MKMEEFTYVVKLTPHIKVESKILGKATFFYLKDDEVMASLRVWDGDIEPVGRLTKTWVQIRGVPPKWTNWITIKEIASSLGRLSEIDWQTLFSSLFRVVRIKINCKDPKMIPEKRVAEIDDNLFMLYFTVEGLEQESSNPKGDEDKGDEYDGEGEEDENPLEENHEGGEREVGKKDESKKDKDTNKPRDLGSASEKRTPRAKQTAEQRASSVKRALLFMDEKLEGGEIMRGLEKSSGANLLQAMELGDFDEEMEIEGNQEGREDMLPLPEEWVYDFSLFSGENSSQGQEWTETVKEDTTEKESGRKDEIDKSDEEMTTKMNAEKSGKGDDAVNEAKTRKK
jgi:hypothetical protein